MPAAVAEFVRCHVAEAGCLAALLDDGEEGALRHRLSPGDASRTTLKG